MELLCCLCQGLEENGTKANNELYSPVVVHKKGAPSPQELWVQQIQNANTTSIIITQKCY